MAFKTAVTRFTYVPDEYFETIDAAFGAKPMAEWKVVFPQVAFYLQIENISEKVTMRCLDGQMSKVFIFFFT
jgi:hypothetical protein